MRPLTPAISGRYCECPIMFAGRYSPVPHRPPPSALSAGIGGWRMSAVSLSKINSPMSFPAIWKSAQNAKVIQAASRTNMRCQIFVSVMRVVMHAQTPLDKSENLQLAQARTGIARPHRP